MKIFSRYYENIYIYMQNINIYVKFFGMLILKIKTNTKINIQKYWNC